MKLPFNPFRKRRPSEPPPAARVELRRNHPRTQVRRRDAVYPAPESPPPAPEPTSPPETATRPQDPPTRSSPSRARNRTANPRAVRGYGRRSSPPPEAPPQRGPNPPRLKSEAELRHEMGPTMQYDDPT
jgi:hypothetical protein